MSTNIRLKKVCLHCKKSFIAKTTVTKFCSHVCNSRYYKKQKREQKITNAVLETNHELQSNYAAKTQGAKPDSANKRRLREGRLHQDWINIRDVSVLLGIGERTIFRLLKDPGFPRLKIGRRLLFNKQQVMDYFISKSEGL